MLSDLFPFFPRPGTAARLPLESGTVTDDLPKVSWKHARPFRLGDFEVLPASGELVGRRGIQRVRPLLMDIVLRLSAQPGEVVRRETLLEDVWPRRMVNDEVLSRAIAELRTALGDDARDARYIETLPKIGYRLLASVGEPTPAVATSAAVPAALPAKPKRAQDAGHRDGARRCHGRLAWLALERSRDPRAQSSSAPSLEARPFTSDPARELNPRFSHDGKRIAFALARATRPASSCSRSPIRPGASSAGLARCTLADLLPRRSAARVLASRKPRLRDRRT
jgi:DNA-binding winged helix-turn-helix (wHTH) protein